MKYIIDLIENVREQTGGREDFVLSAGLLKEDKSDGGKLICKAEILIDCYVLDESNRQLLFYIDGNGSQVTIGELIPKLLIQSTDVMMYELRVHINNKYKEIEVVEFGKNENQKRYILFVKI